MIIFYNKKSGEVIGTVNGRVHSEEELKVSVKPSDTPQKDIGKYVVPFEPNMVEEDVELTELRMVDEKTKRVERVVIGKEKRMVKRGLRPAVPFKQLIYDFELGKDSVYNYRVKIKGKALELIKK